MKRLSAFLYGIISYLIFFGVYFEEKAVKHRFGEDYEACKVRVPKFFRGFR